MSWIIRLLAAWTYFEDIIMRFTIGNLNLATVLLMTYLFPVMGKPAPKHTCKPVRLAEMEKEQMAHILKQYKHLNGENLNPLSLSFSQLHIHSASPEEKKMDAVCGVNYTQYALESIEKHQQELNPSKTHFLEYLNKTVHSLEGTLKLCLENVLNVTCKKHANPEFPEKMDHYTRKQWSLAALQHIVKFFDELINFLQKNNSHPH